MLKRIEYDYENQCWVVDGIIQRCGHPDSMNCRCYGKLHEGAKRETGNTLTEECHTQIHEARTLTAGRNHA